MLVELKCIFVLLFGSVGYSLRGISEGWAFWSCSQLLVGRDEDKGCFSVGIDVGTRNSCLDRLLP